VSSGALLLSMMIGVLCVSQALGEQLGFAGVGTSSCAVVTQSAIPGRGPTQNDMTVMIFSWIQGYMSGFNGYSYLVKGGTYDLGSASPEAQWEYIVSFCRSNPNTIIVRALQEMQAKLLTVIRPPQ
jgi:hypothetical protein